jgi:hypothetical protein
LDPASGAGYLSITAESAASQEIPMIATALHRLAHAVGARRADRARSVAELRTTPTSGTTRVFHPMGAIRIVTPAEEHAQRDGRADQAAAPHATGMQSPSVRPQPPGPRGQAEDIHVANFGTRLAHPCPEALASTRTASVATTGASTGVRARLRRALQRLLHALDDAPFDLAWPPTHRRWPTNVPAWRADRAGGEVIIEEPRQRRVA